MSELQSFEIKKKDLKFQRIAGITMSKAEAVHACEMHNEYTIFYILSKVGKIKYRTYIARRKKTWITEELEWEQFLAELKSKNYEFKKDDEGRIHLVHNKRGIIRSILSS